MLKNILVMAFLHTAGIAFPQCYFYSTYDYVSRNGSSTTIIEASDGSFISIGSNDELIGIGDGIYIVKTDECGSVLWESFNILSPGGGGKLHGQLFKS